MQKKNINIRVAIFLFLMIQMVFAVAGGLTVLYMSKKSDIPPNVFVNNKILSGISEELYKKDLQIRYESALKYDYLIIKTSTGTEFKVKFSSLGAQINYSTTLTKYNDLKPENALVNLFSGYFSNTSTVIFPDITFDSEKIKQTIIDFSKKVDRLPKNAKVSFGENNLKKTHEENGYKLDQEKLYNVLEKNLGVYVLRSLDLSHEHQDLIEVKHPQVTLSDLSGINEIIGSYTTQINTFEQERTAKFVANVLNNSMVESSLKKNVTNEFSMREKLKTTGVDMSSNTEGIDLVASTLHAALLLSGIDHDITRFHNQNTVDYIDPGLDVHLDNEKDYKFKNNLDFKLMILAEVINGKVNINIAGKQRNDEISKRFVVEKEQRISPSVVYIASSELESGEKKVIQPGREGVSINLYRIASRNGVEQDKQLIYSDKYNAKERVIHIGPNTEIIYDEK